MLLKQAFSAPHISLRRSCAAWLLCAVFCGTEVCTAQKKPAPKAEPDVLVLVNGDTLHGKFVRSVSNKVTFHTDALGNITVPWKKIRELHTVGSYAVLKSKTEMHSKMRQGAVPAGTLDMTNQTITLQPPQAPAVPPIPVKQAQYVVSSATLAREATRRTGVFSGWSGAATAGATMVAATQKQYTFSGGISLVRAEPSVTWLARRNRTAVNFSASFGKITQPAYLDTTTNTMVPAQVTKTAIYHADAERDQYFSTRFFALVQTAFDHNFSQNLDLQQIYGGGIGWTAIKTPSQEADLKATTQYAKQVFLSGAPGSNQNLVGSTFSANYALNLPLLSYSQSLAFIPAYNNPHAYSLSEVNTLAFPAYKNLSFSIGTQDSYLNNPPVSLPPTQRNSFQFTMGITFAIKPRY